MPTTLTDHTTASDFQLNLSGKKAIITGASRGIGKAIALAFAKAGCQIAICARQEASLASAQKEILQYSPTSIVKRCDVSQEAELVEFISQSKKHLGGIDILINNAGQYKSQPVNGHGRELWQQIIETNLTAAMIASREVLKSMLKQEWGRIINISSISGRAGEINGSAYSASKFGLIGLTQSLALEVAKYGITVNAVCPGWVETQMAKNQLKDESWCETTGVNPSDSEEIARLSVPQMRFIDPQEVAQLTLFLCSNSARGITGQAINICGGLSIH